MPMMLLTSHMHVLPPFVSSYSHNRYIQSICSTKTQPLKSHLSTVASIYIVLCRLDRFALHINVIGSSFYFYLLKLQVLKPQDILNRLFYNQKVYANTQVISQKIKLDCHQILYSIFSLALKEISSFSPRIHMIAAYNLSVKRNLVSAIFNAFKLSPCCYS